VKRRIKIVAPVVDGHIVIDDEEEDELISFEDTEGRAIFGLDLRADGGANLGYWVGDDWTVVLELTPPGGDVWVRRD
jgi:hypothetical protein